MNRIKRTCIVCLIPLLMTSLAGCNNSVNEQRNNCVFAGAVTLNDGSQDKGIFLHNWKENTNTKLFPLDENTWIVNMNYSEDHNKIIALTNQFEILEYNLVENETNTIINRAMLEKLLSEAQSIATSDEVLSDNAYENKAIHNVFYYEDGIAFDYQCSLYYLSGKDDSLQIKKIDNLPEFDRCYYVNRDQLILEIGEQERGTYTLEPHLVEFYLYNPQNETMELLFGLENVQYNCLGTDKLICFNQERTRIAVSNKHEEPNYCCCKIFDIESKSFLTTVGQNKESKIEMDITELHLLLDSDEVIADFLTNDTMVSGVILDLYILSEQGLEKANHKLLPLKGQKYGIDYISCAL